MQKIISTACGDTISTTTMTVRTFTQTMEVVITADHDGVVLGLKPDAPGSLDGASITLSRDQALAVAARLQAVAG